MLKVIKHWKYFDIHWQACYMLKIHLECPYTLKICWHMLYLIRSTPIHWKYVCIHWYTPYILKMHWEGLYTLEIISEHIGMFPMYMELANVAQHMQMYSQHNIFQKQNI